MKIRTRIVVLAISGICATAMLSLAVGAWQTTTFTARADRKARALVSSDLDHSTESVLNLVKTQRESVALQVDAALRVARRELFEEMGGIGLTPESASWDAVDQLTGEVVKLHLSQMTVGGEWLGQNADPQVESPVVDEVKELTGAVSTIFQRMNKKGDMLRVATNVETAEGKRAIGTFIPAKGPDGVPSPVVESVLAGKTYAGTAYVVDSWYETRYAPMRDERGRISGMLFVGVKQLSVESLRRGILDAQIGSKGRVVVLAADGTDAGQVLISDDPSFPEGEVLLDAEDENGKPFVQSLVSTALSQNGDSVAEGPTVVLGDDGAQEKVHTRVAYFPEWDWMIVGVVPDSEVQSVSKMLDDGRGSMLLALILVCLLAVGVGALVALRVGRRIGHQVESSQRGLEATLARMRAVLQAITKTAARLTTSSEELSGISQALSASAEETSAEARSVSTAAEQVSANVTTVAAGAEEMGASIRDVAGSTTQAASVAEHGVSAAQSTTETVNKLGDSSSEIGEIIKVITSIAEQTNLLALNATIEAARAGEAGKGFAVVANEVKELAKQTAEATEDISRKVVGIQTDAGEAAEAMANIAAVIGEIHEIQVTIAAAVEEQTASSHEIARNISEAASGATEIAGNVTSVAQAAGETSTGAHATQEAAVKLSQLATELNRIVDQSGVALDGDSSIVAMPGAPPADSPESRAHSDAIDQPAA